MAEITIKTESCKGCLYCVHFCPTDCFEVGDKINFMGYVVPVFTNSEECTGCGSCAKMCPDSVIEVYESPTEGTD